MKKSVFSLLILIFSLFSLSAKTILVGYCTDLGNFMIGKADGERKSGYAYEYIQKMAEFTDWEYKYVYGEKEFLKELLSDGKIDILPGLSKEDISKENEEKIVLSDYDIVDFSTYLFVKMENYDKVASLKNLKIGVYRNFFPRKALNEWIDKNNRECEVILYNSNKEKIVAFDNDEVDLILELDFLADKNWEPFDSEKIESNNFRIGVTSSRKDIINELNEAQFKILENNSLYRHFLYEKYFSKRVIQKSLTETEKKWLSDKKEIKIGCLRNYYPYCKMNEKTLQPEGLIVDIVKSIEENSPALKSKIKYEFYDSYFELQNSLCAKRIDAAFPVINDLYNAEKFDFYLSDQIISVNLGILYLKDKLNDLDKIGELTESISTLKNQIIYAKLQNEYLNSYICGYENFNECVNAVVNGRADSSILEMQLIENKIFKNRKAKKLEFSSFPERLEIKIAVNHEEKAFIGLINKGISTISDDYKSLLLAKYNSKANEFTFKNFFKEYFVLLLLGLIFFLGLIFVVIILLSKLYSYINYDALTHLLNRKSMNSYLLQALRRANEDKGTFCMALIDIDNFKKVNDTYGHECGDLVLKGFSNIISRGINSQDFVFRWGGEEILILFNTNVENAKASCERIRRTIEAYSVEYKGNFVSTTITIGISAFTKGDSVQDMFIQADEKLYKGKKNGKNQVVM